MKKKREKKKLTEAYALQSFLGFLEGTGKAKHSIKSYQSDVIGFLKFLEKELDQTSVRLEDVTLEDLKSYEEFLRSEGYRTNTRRRKLLTVRRLFRYLTKRKKLNQDIALKLPAPHKVERVPRVVPLGALIRKVRHLPDDSLFDLRNRVLLWTLAETGCLVSEIPPMKFSYWKKSGDWGNISQPSLKIVGQTGKRERWVPVSVALLSAVQELEQEARVVERASRVYCFTAFNKFGPLGQPISDRGVELLVRSYANRLGFPELRPRLIRHSAAVLWNQQSVDQDEIRRRLGLKTDYAFRSYEPLFKSNSKTTSTS